MMDSLVRCSMQLAGEFRSSKIDNQFVLMRKWAAPKTAPDAAQVIGDGSQIMTLATAFAAPVND